MNEMEQKCAAQQAYEQQNAKMSTLRCPLCGEFCVCNGQSSAGTQYPEGSALGGKIPYPSTSADNFCNRPGLLDRVRDQKDRAEFESHKASRLGELTYLLDKNPEVARILDLLEDVRG